MSIVWRAFDQQLERTVAVKMMSDSLAAHPTAVARFAREARTHAKIVHPNLVQVYDYCVSGPQPYLVLEYVSGDTLSRRLNRSPLDADELRRLASDLLAAIACIHDHGVLHRDIKPANVLLGSEGHARLTDFGIAQLESSTRLTSPGDVVGTLRFLAPELLDGDPPSRQSDLFALGVLLRAAAGATVDDPALARLIVWLTEPGPGLRPPDAQTAMRALRDDQPTVLTEAPTVLTEPPTVITQPPTVLMPRRRGRGRTRLAASLAALALLIAAAASMLVPGPGPAARSSARHQHLPALTKGVSYRHTGGTSSFDARLRQLASGVRAAARP